MIVIYRIHEAILKSETNEGVVISGPGLEVIKLEYSR